MALAFLIPSREIGGTIKVEFGGAAAEKAVPVVFAGVKIFKAQLREKDVSHTSAKWEGSLCQMV